jgi:hypothetical protein
VASARNLVRLHAVIGTFRQSVLIGLAMLGLVACVASQARGPAGLRPAYDRMLLGGDISVAETHVRDFGYDPGALSTCC